MDEQDDIEPAVAAAVAVAAADADSDAGADDANGDDQIGVPVHSSDQEELAEPPSPERTNPNKDCKTEEGFGLGYKLEEDNDREEDKDKEKDAGVRTSTGSSKGYMIDETTPVWVKRKRTTRTQVSSDENTAADSLVFMKVCRTDPPSGNETDQESYAESSGEEENEDEDEDEDEDAKLDELQQASSSQIVLYNPPSTSRHVFQCSTCNKVFSSHQALGGHRASHKRVKGCFASKLASSTGSPFGPIEEGNVNPRPVATDFDQAPIVETPARVRRKNTGERLHECTICLRQFSSGQALGGHKRCHWMSPSARESAFSSSSSAPPLVRNHLSVNHPSPAPPPPPARTGQSAETREVQIPPATMTPASSTSSMHNVPSASASGSGSGGANVNLSNLPCMDGVASDWLHLHVGADPVEPSDDNNGES